MRKKHLSVFIFLYFLASNLLFAQTQSITSATYNSATGVFAITALNLDDTLQLIDASRLVISDGTYARTLSTTTDADPVSQTLAILTVTGEDKLYLNVVLDANGTGSSRGGTYNIAANSEWNGPLSLPDMTGNPITVFNYAPPSITSATYNAGTGQMVVTGARLGKYAGFDIDASMFTIKGKASGTYTLASGTSDKEIDSETSFTLNIGGTDKVEVDKLIDDNGTSSSDAVTYNLAGADGWNMVVNTSHPDLTGNGITASNVNYAPSASDLHFGGTNAMGSTIKARFTYSDPESDPPGSHIYEWFRSPTGVGAGTSVKGPGIDSTYTLASADTGYYIRFDATPVAASGRTPGETISGSWLEINHAPRAGDLRYAGSNGFDSTLIARFTYSDPEDDSPGASLFRWYRSPNGIDSWLSITIFRTDSSYKVIAADTGKYLRFSVTPVALTGTTPGYMRYSSTVKVNKAPKAFNLGYAGSNGLDSTITATYSYYDEEGDAEGDPIFQWLRSAAGTGAGTPITGQTNSDYVITTGDTGQYISFRVTPTALTGTTPGATRQSAWLEVNKAPKAAYLHYSGSNGLDSTIIASFTYYDKEGDEPGAHTFRWSRSATGTGNGGYITPTSTDSTYTILASDTGQYIRFEVTPKALTGTTPGFIRKSAWLKVNTRPRVTNLGYSGWNGLDSTITASFTFVDADSDSPGNHIYTWYYSTTGTGLGESVKGPSTDSTYTIKPSDIGNYISYDIIPVALTGTTPGREVRSPWFKINTPPVASSLSVTGILNIGDSLMIDFDYFDVEGDAEGDHKYQWYISNTSSWSFANPIANDTLDRHIITKNEETRYLGCIVTPYALTGTVKGLPKQSPLVGKVNSLPDATSPVIIAPSILVGDTLTADFTYNDLDGDLPGDHIYEWYKATSSSGAGRSLISGETDSFYIALPQDKNRWIAFEVKPVARTGSSPGDSVLSPWTGPIGENIPSATISGGDSICPDDPIDAQITINIAGGTPPFEITYNNGTKDTTISDLDEREYIFTTHKAGEYTLVNVADKFYDTGIVSPDVVIVYVYDEVRAVLTGTAQICNDSVSVAPLHVNFTGTAPWTFELGITPGPDTIYTDVTQDPFTFNARYAAKYRIKTLSDAHCQGDTVGSGTATISYKASPQAVISGIDTICPGDTANLTVTLSSGSVPWSFTYTRNNTNPTIISGIMETVYTLKVLNEGIYKLEGVEDISCTGLTTGIGRVVYRSLPTAALSGGGLMCEGASTNLVINLTGTAPWNFKYRLTNDNITDTLPVNNIFSSPRLVEVNPDTLTYYTLTEVTDRYCPGTVSGNATISVIPAPEVELLGLKPAYNIETLWVPIFGNPEGGEFGGTNAIVEKDDTTFFLPFFAGLTYGNPHTITYIWQEPSTSCWGADTAHVEVIQENAEINFPDNKKFYCYNDTAFTITGANIIGDTGTFTISGGAGLVDNGNNTATITPSEELHGTFTVTYTYLDEIPIPIADNFEIQVVPDIFFYFDQHTFCDNAAAVKLNGNVSEGVFYGNSVSGNPSAGYYFVPEMADPGVDTIFYKYTTTQGCYREVFDTAFIYEAPAIAFEVDDVCVAVGENDPTAFINNTTSTDPISSWLWNFGDVNSGEANTSTLKNPTHVYTSIGSKNVSLRGTTNKGCQATLNKIYNFGDNPVVGFSWGSECFVNGIPINFKDNSSCNEGSITSYEWKFYHNQGYATSYLKDPSYTYSTYGDYNVELTAESEYGCTKTKTKIIHLRPTKKLAQEEYYEDFNDNASYWVSNYVNDGTFSTNNWVYGFPGSPFNGGTPVTKVWYTNIGATSPKEKSWVTSPCFDFRGTKRPMIKLNIWRAFDGTRDGAVLQYTYNNGKTWTTLGELDDGINWYNKYNILGQPGDDHIGWSDITDNNWIEARHKLDDLRARTNVQFRIAYGSNGSAIGNDGIAFDNISIEERDKITLIEHFTNYTDSACRAADSILNSIVNSCMDAVDLHFHMPYPGQDPFYNHNKNVVDSRKLYYGLQTYDVPYSIMDGGYDYDHLFNYESDNNTIKVTDVDIESLTDPDFEIELTTQNTGSSVNVSATLRALKQMSNKYLRFHIVVIEREITQVTPEGGEEIYESIVKAMLPSVAGTSYNQSWIAGQEEEVDYSWTFTNVFDADEIRVVAFIQDDNTFQVYQAAIDSMDYISSIGDDIILKQDMKTMIFPNPAYGTTYLKFNQPVYREAELKLYSSMGVLVYSLRIPEGSDLISFNTGNLRKGLYILRVVINNKVVDTKKLIISQ